jgi:hypothetical protein
MEAKMSDTRIPTERELKLTAAVYARLGAAKHVRETGMLPDRIGGAWNYMPINRIIRERGTDLTLTPDEQLIFDAIIRERRLPGGSVCLIEEEHEIDPADERPQVRASVQARIGSGRLRAEGKTHPHGAER